MAFGVDSAGFGHGRCGHGPCGHGPWLTFPFTPGYPYQHAQAYAVEAPQFEDGTEQRFLRATEPGGQLTYTFPRVDSAMALAVSSWVQAAIGPATRFRVLEHRTQRPLIVRMADDTWGTARGPGIGRDSGMTFTVCRDVTYAEEVMADSPVAYWRLGDATGVSTAVDASGTGKHAAIVQGLNPQQTGALVGDWDTAYAVTSGAGTAGYARVGSVGLGDAMTVEFWFQHLAPGAVAQHALVAWSNSGAAWWVKFLNGKITTHQNTAGTQFSVTSKTYADSLWHHFVWARSAAGPTTGAVYLDATLATGTVTSSLPTPGVHSLALFSFNGAQGFEGTMDEVALYPAALSADRVLAHYRAGTRP
jgi:hypothetical protein